MNDIWNIQFIQIMERRMVLFFFFFFFKQNFSHSHIPICSNYIFYVAVVVPEMSKVPEFQLITNQQSSGVIDQIIKW